MKTVLEMKKDDRVGSIYPTYLHGSVPVPMLRNRVVKNALERGSDYILMIDYDMAPDPLKRSSKPFWRTAWEFLMDRRANEDLMELPPATVAAPYFANSEEEFFSSDWVPGHGEKGLDHVVPITKEDALSRSGIDTVASTQTGLILYDARVFHVIPQPWFDYAWEDETRMRMVASEDHYQTVKSGQHGCPVFMAWDCWSGHIKHKMVMKDQPPAEEMEAIANAVHRGERHE